MSESAFAQHIIDSIHKELELLKTHNYLQPQVYNDIVNLLPKNLSRNMQYPPVHPQVLNPSPSTAHIPSPAHSQALNTNALPPPPSYSTVNEKSLGTAEALYDFQGDNPSTDLSMRRGDIIQLLEFVNNDWWKGTLNGKTGIFPSNYVKKIETPLNEKRASRPPPSAPVYGGGYSNQNSYNSHPTNNYAAATPPGAPNNSYAPANNYVSAPVNNYAPPPIQNQVNSYAPPPTQQVASGSTAPVAEEQHESKVSSLGKKFAGNVANAATWGFGATIGSDIAHSIF